MKQSELISHLDTATNQVKTKRKKRLWREIEAIKDKYRLRRELRDLDLVNQTDLGKLDF